MSQFNQEPIHREPEFKTLIDEVKLPSQGLFYPNNKEGKPIDSVYIEYMTALDEEYLQTPALIQSGEAFNMLLKRKIKTKDINIDDLLVGDKNAILIYLRMTAYGANYPVKVTCPDTGVEFEEMVDLTKLKHKPFIHHPFGEKDGKDLWEYTFTIGDKKHVAHVRLLTAKEEERVTRDVSDKRDRGDYTASFRLERYIRQIVTLDGNDNKIRIGEFIKNLPPLEGRKFEKFITEIEPALDMSYEFTSPRTGSRFQDQVQLGFRFFYPES